MRPNFFAALLLIICTFMLNPAFGHAQSDDPAYRLRSMTGDEYAQSLIPIFEQYRQDGAGEFVLQDFSAALSTALFAQYPANYLPYDTLIAAYDGLDIQANYYQRDDWVRRIVPAYITDNDIDLSLFRGLEFADFHITVLQRDFDGDGRAEYLLDIVKGESIVRAQEGCPASEIADYLIVQETSDGYRFINPPLPHIGRWDDGGPFFGNGGMVELGFRDLTGDSVPEWIVVNGGSSDGDSRMSSFNAGRLLILSWRDGQLYDLAPAIPLSNTEATARTTSFFSNSHPCDTPAPDDIVWNFSNINSDQAIEFTQSQVYRDNWLCETTKMRVFDCDDTAEQFVYVETRTEADASSSQCLHRQAEERMWHGDFTAAIDLYQQSINALYSPPRARGYFSYERSLYEYLRARLALAYLLTGQIPQANRTLETFTEEAFELGIWEFDSETILNAQFVNVLRDSVAEHVTPLQTCIAVYNLFTNGRPNIYVGYTREIVDIDFGSFESRSFLPPYYRPEYAGCDAPQMLLEFLEDKPIPLTQTPPMRLEGIGVEINRFMATDLNGDQRREWLVWPDVNGVELFFNPQDEQYRVSASDVDPYLEYDFPSTIHIIEEQLLPDQAGSALAQLRTVDMCANTPPWSMAYFENYGCGGPGPYCTSDDVRAYGQLSLTLFRLDEGTLAPFFSSWICERTLGEVFRDGDPSSRLYTTQVACDPTTFECERIIETEVIYTWDAEQQNFIAPPQPSSTPSPTQTPTQTATPDPYPQYNFPRQAFAAGDYGTYVEMVSADVPLSNDSSLDYALSERYLRGIALLELGRDEDALTQFVSIMQSAPESIWAPVAALHVEAINPD